MASTPFLAGEIVWAQYEEQPYWPGRVVPERITSQLVKHNGADGVGILFFGKPLSYALIPCEKVVDFSSNFENFNNGSDSVEFKMALKMAMSNDEASVTPLIIVHRSTFKYSRDISISTESEMSYNSEHLDCRVYDSQ
ncbi:hypothetical protein PAEPH01_0933 [Pancytospora epiphaga]|nr:hypothetical protein PAEPH01_0933 [Pancytospora epiphaga]